MSGLRISIVTPSYDQAPFLEATIRSVLTQECEDLEYIIIDGESNDNSVEIIHKYASQLAYWVSERDNGQAHAINKGFARATGEVTAWLNSDDRYQPGALERAMRLFKENLQIAVVVGRCALIDQNGKLLGYKEPCYFDTDYFLSGGLVPGQPAVFFRREVLDTVGYLDESLHYVLDWEFWLRIGRTFGRERILLLDEVLAEARMYEGTKTSLGIERSTMERRRVLRKFFAVADLPPSIRELERRAYSNTYWKEAELQLSVGRRRAALLNVGRAIVRCPRAYHSGQIVRIMAKIFLPTSVIRRLRRS